MAGFNTSMKAMSINTIFLGQCYLVQAIKHNRYSYDTADAGLGLLMNLVGNDSVADFFVIPSYENSEVSAIVDRWTHPINPIEIRNYNFLKLIMVKERHVKKSTIGFPCTDLPEQNYTKVM